MAYPAHIADFSHWNSPAIEDFIAAGFSAFIFKATEGSAYKDDKYDGYVAKADTLKVPYGTYHYFRVSHDPVAQARFYFDNASKAPILPAIDVERFNNVNLVSQQTFSYKLQDSVEKTAELFNREPMIYTSWGAWDQLIGSYGAWAGKYPLWVASYGTVTPTMPRPWSTWVLWQYTRTYQLGSKGYDANWLNNGWTLDDLITRKPTLEERVVLLEAKVNSLNRANNNQNRQIRALEDKVARLETFHVNT